MFATCLCLARESHRKMFWLCGTAFNCTVEYADGKVYRTRSHSVAAVADPSIHPTFSISEYKIPLLSASPTLCFNCHAAKSQVLLPCVEAGLEMALLHVTAKASGTAIGVAMSKASGDLPCRGTIEINALSTRNESRTPTGEVR